MQMGPDPMDFGVSLGGANSLYTITKARSKALLTARVADDTSQGSFRIENTKILPASCKDAANR